MTLLPLLHLFNNQDVTESFGFKGYLFKLLETLNLHNSYRIILFLIILAFIVKGIFIFLTFSYNSFLKGRLLVSLKKRLFYSYSPGESYLIEGNKTEKISCKKQQPKDRIVALSSVLKPSDVILNKLKEHNVTSIVKMASSYKFCVIATGEYDIYAARERANEWDYAAGHAIAQNAGAIIKTLDEKPFLYGKENYKNPSLLIKRSNNLND